MERGVFVGRVEPLEGRLLFSTVIDTGGWSGEPTYWLGGFVEANGILLFANDDGVHGRELWRSDGTPEGTRLLKDIRPGSGEAVSRLFAGPSGVAYFAADDGESGSEMWRSDGTRRGTWMLRDVGYPGGSDPEVIQAEGSTVLFRAGSNVLRTDGSAKHTHAIVGGRNMTLAREKVYYLSEFEVPFRPPGEGDWPEVLWRLGGRPGVPVSEDPVFDGAELFPDGGRILVYRSDLGGVWSFDPLSNVLTPVATVTPGQRLVAFERVGDQLFVVVGTEEYTYVGFPDHNPTVDGTVELYVSDASQPGGRKLWQHTFADVRNFSYEKMSFTAVGDAVYFTPIVNKYGELWRSDGTVAGTRRVMASANRSTVTNLVDSAGTLHFVNAGKLWESDGTPGGTHVLFELPSPREGPGTAPELTAVDGRLFFVGSDPNRGSTLWTYSPDAKKKLRRLVSSVPPAALVDGVLTVYGYERDDRLSVNKNKGTLTLNWNGAKFHYAAANVRAIRVYGQAGRDVIRVDAGPAVGVMLDGGEGDDNLTGGAGNDVLRGGWGADTLTGGAGDDWLDGEDSVDWLYGDDGNDLFRSRDGVRDYVSGGAGIDSAEPDRVDWRVGVERLVKA